MNITQKSTVPAMRAAHKCAARKGGGVSNYKKITSIPQVIKYFDENMPMKVISTPTGKSLQLALPAQPNGGVGGFSSRTRTRMLTLLFNHAAGRQLPATTFCFDVCIIRAGKCENKRSFVHQSVRRFDNVIPEPAECRCHQHAAAM